MKSKKKLLALFLSLSMLACLLPSAFALDADEPFAEDEAEVVEDAEVIEPVIVNEDETYFNNGGLVFNNGGTVYNNLGEVYNNDGTVYNNLGTVYNNGGACYNNGGTVYDNGGYIRNNGGIILLPDDTKDEADAEPVEEAEETSDNEEKSEAEESGKALLPAPVFNITSGTYADTTEVTITAADNSVIYYTLDGSEPTKRSHVYTDNLYLNRSAVLTAVAINEDGEMSEPAVLEFNLLKLSAPKFSSVKVGYERPEAVAVTVTNPGSTDAVIESVKLEGDNADCFELNTEDGAVIKAETVDDSTWTLRPIEKLKAGNYTAELIFTYDSGESCTLNIIFKVK